MIATHLIHGPIRTYLAGAVRTVNARHAEVGAPELLELKEAWSRLDRSLSLASVAGDERAARAAVDSYRRDALAAIEEAA